MKTLISKTAATAAAAAIAMTGFAATPAKALTDDEAALLFFGTAAILMMSGAHSHATPTPPPPPPPTPRPRTFSTGFVTLPQTWSVNLDNGRVGGRGADLWFQARDATHRYLTPVNGARMAVGPRTNRGYAGCARARYSARSVPLYRIPVGSYVCVKTSAGRISQFRVNAIYGGTVKTIRMGYTTWRR